MENTEKTIVLTVDKIIWQNEDGKKGKGGPSQWKLMLASAPCEDWWPDSIKNAHNLGEPAKFMLTGEVATPDYGAQKFDATGKWKFDTKKNKYTFAADYIAVHFPVTREDVVQFLRHCGARIGVRVANAIIDKFGTDLLDIASKPDEVAAQVKGISYRGACKMADKVQLLEATTNLVKILRPAGVDYSDIVKIAREYGSEASTIVTEQPYAMWRTIGFVTCDKVGLAMGKPVTDTARLNAAVWSQYATIKGKTAAIMVERNALAAKVNSALNRSGIGIQVSLNDINAHLDWMLAQHTAVKSSIAGPNGETKTFFYSKEDFVSERNLAQNVFKLAHIGVSDRDKGVQDYEAALEDWSESGLVLSGKQKEAVANVGKAVITALTGGPGTGKTTCLRAIIDCYQQAYPDSPVVLMAPTGLAAKRMTDATGRPALTVHKALGLVPSAHSIGGFAQESDSEDLSGLVIVDESSMLGIHIAGFLMDTVVYTPATRIVFVGDIDQLPPVSQGTFFEDIINSGVVPVTRLDRNFRQEAGNTIIDAAYAINGGDYKGIKFTNDFEYIETAEEDIAQKVIDSFMSGKDIYGLKQTFILSPTRKAGPLCTNILNKRIQELVNPPAPGKTFMTYGSTTFRQGDRVICLKNDAEMDVVNGDIGYVTNAATGNSGEMELLVQFEGNHIVSFTKDKLEHIELAYAITVHKSQGCEFDCVVIPASFTQKVMLYRNLFYTAVTRAKKKVFVVGVRNAINTAIRTIPPKTDKSLLCLRLRTQAKKNV